MNVCGFRPPVCTYRLKWARRTSWGWWNEWDDTALQTDSSSGGLGPSTLPLGHGGSPQYITFTSERREKIRYFETWMPERRTELLRLSKQTALTTASCRAPTNKNIYTSLAEYFQIFSIILSFTRNLINHGEWILMILKSILNRFSGNFTHTIFKSCGFIFL